MTSNVLLTKSDTQTIFIVSCFAPKTVGDFVQMAASNCNWICTFRNQGQKLGISVLWSITRGYGYLLNPPQIPIDMASVKIDRRLDFDIVLSNWTELYQIRKTKVMKDAKTTATKSNWDEGAPKLKDPMSPLLKDISTMNMAFTFGLNGSVRNAALWVHQSVLSRQSSIAALIEKSKDVETDPSSSAILSGVKTTHINEYPSKPTAPWSGVFSASCKNRPAIDCMFTARKSSSTNADSDEAAEPGLVVKWSNLFQVADCYQVTEHREYCVEKIVEMMDNSTALDVLYGFTYRYPDLKEIVLQYVVDNISNLYAASQDPFAAFEGHPERYTLLTEVLQIVFKDKAQA
ncbi:hypothetical protein BGZ74_000118 [Mortierella antarctica]|nr:hypothetical protein BGZ74_000118 [Mortierella antarctica]